MMRMFCAIRASTIVGVFMIFHSPAQAANPPQSMQLSDAQLDKIAAGLVPGVFVSAKGDGNAEGQLSYAEVTVSAVARTPGHSDGTAVGQVNAIAISAAGPLASASSTLSLSVAIP